MKRNMQFLVFLTYFSIIKCGLHNSASYFEYEYHGYKYDPDKNCSDVTLLQKLEKEDGAARCTTLASGSDAYQWEECKKDLSFKLIDYCNMNLVKKTGKPLYCKQKNLITCCFNNTECAETYKIVENEPVVHHDMVNRAVEFMKDPDKYIKEEVERKKYDTCHLIKEYDATKCQQDCLELEKSDFAEDCKKKNGLFKCCIRRDKAFCHECRFCCTLSMCSTTGGTFFQNNSRSTLAELGYTTDKKLWKFPDYRCLKPKPDVPPEKWPHYEMSGFRAAETKQELENVTEIKFDKNFFNLEDPKVFERMIKGKQNTKLWKKTYGFDFVSFNTQNPPNQRLTSCYENCLKAESGEFAAKCRRKKGVFKCCTIKLETSVYETIRFKLQELNLTKNGNSERICKKKGFFTTCDLCATTHICAASHPVTGVVEEHFKTPYSNLQHNIGGRHRLRLNSYNNRQPTGHGLKYWACAAMDACKQDGKGNKYYNPFGDFMKASTKAKFCNLTQLDESFPQGAKRNESYQKMFYEDCMRQHLHSVRFCSEKNNCCKKEDEHLRKIYKQLENKKNKKKGKRTLRSLSLSKPNRKSKEFVETFLKKPKRTKKTKKSRKNKQKKRKRKPRRKRKKKTRKVKVKKK